jgi:hypothetical protein
VTLPLRATGRALVRCPLCLEEYLLAEAIAHAPPELVIIGGEVPTQEISDKLEEPTDRATVDYQFTEDGLSASVVEPTAGEGTAAARTPLRSVPRPRKNEKNAAVEGIKVVLGGIVGLSLGLLALWWIPPGRDDFELGPKVASYVPWIVPAKFHPERKPSGEESTGEAPKKAVAVVNKPVNSGKLENAAPKGSSRGEPMPDLKDLLPD